MCNARWRWLLQFWACDIFTIDFVSASATTRTLKPKEFEWTWREWAPFESNRRSDFLYILGTHSPKNTRLQDGFPKSTKSWLLDESSMKLHRLHTEASYWHEENDECRVPKMPGNWHSGNCLRDCMQTVYMQCWSCTSKTLKQEFQEVNMNSMHPGSSVACNSTAVPSTFTCQIPKSCSSNLVATWKKHQTTPYNASVQRDVYLHIMTVPASLNFTGTTKDRSTWVCAWDRDLHISIFWSTHINLVCCFKMLKNPHLFYLCGCGGCNIYSHFQGDIHMLSFWRFLSESARTFTKIFLLQRMNRCVSQRWVSQTAKCMTVSSWWEIWQQVIVNPLSECGTQVWGQEVGKYPGIGSAFQRFQSFLSPVFLLNLDIHGPNVKARQAIVSRTVFPHLSMAPQWNCIPRLQTFKAWL